MLKLIQELSSAERMEFSRLVGEAKSHALVVVHPFFKGWDYSSTGITLDRLEQLLFPDRTRVLPAIVLESPERLEEFVAWVKKVESWGRKRRRMAFSLTDSKYPTPINESWEGLADKISGVGVKSVFVCGRLLEVFDRRREDYDALIDAMEARVQQHGGCVDVEGIRAEEQKDKRVQETERGQLERIWLKREEALRRVAANRHEIEEARQQLFRGLNCGFRKCVGTTYNQFVLAQRFDRVRVARKYCK